MKTILALFIAFAGSTAFAKPETRCGWIENPTPANYSIIDADGEWIISVQGGYQAEGDVAFPNDYDNNYVKTNINYGYFYHLAYLYHFVRVSHITIGQLAGMHQSILVNAYIYKGAKIGDICYDA